MNQENNKTDLYASLQEEWQRKEGEKEIESGAKAAWIVRWMLWVGESEI